MGDHFLILMTYTHIFVDSRVIMLEEIRNKSPSGHIGLIKITKNSSFQLNSNSVILITCIGDPAFNLDPSV